MRALWIISIAVFAAMVFVTTWASLDAKISGDKPKE